MNAGVLVEGCRGMEGCSPSALENGTYLLQPPSYRRDVASGMYLLGKRQFPKKASQPAGIPPEFRHYVLTSHAIDPETNMPLRRHLTFNGKLRRWEISPLCDSIETLLCVSVGEKFDGGWCQRILALAETGEMVSGRLARGLGGGNAGGAEEDDDDELEEEEEDEVDELFVAPQPWTESSHQFALLGSDRLQLLALDGGQMAGEMHPELQTFLRNNKIEVGESLDRLRANHAAVLSLITGTRRSLKSAYSILGGEFHLTGDSIFKMHAIYARLACGIPVVLSGVDCLVLLSTAWH